MGLIFDLDQTLIDSSIADQPRKLRQWQRVYSLIPSFYMYDSILEVIQSIRLKHIPFAIVTSSPESYCVKVLSNFKIQCEYRVCYHDTRFKKPHPEPILLAARKLDCEIKSIYSFGDRDIDIKASNDAGVNSVACLWGASDPDSLLSSAPALVLNHPVELLEFVRGL